MFRLTSESSHQQNCCWLAGNTWICAPCASSPCQHPGPCCNPGCDASHGCACAASPYHPCCVGSPFPLHPSCACHCSCPAADLCLHHRHLLCLNDSAVHVIDAFIAGSETHSGMKEGQQMCCALRPSPVQHATSSPRNAYNLYLGRWGVCGHQQMPKSVHMDRSAIVRYKKMPPVTAAVAEAAASMLSEVAS